MTSWEKYADHAAGWSEAQYADARTYLARRAELVRSLGPRLSAGDLVLDLACGDGGLADFLPEQRYVGVDASEEMVAAGLVRGRELVHADLNDYEPSQPVQATTIFRAIYYARDRRNLLERIGGYTEVKLVFDLNPRQFRLAEGSIGRALELASAGSLALYREMVEVLSTLPDLDMARLHGFAERFARRGEEANADWRSLNYLFDGWLKGLLREGAVGEGAAPVVPAERGLRAKFLAAASLDRWMEAWEKVARLLSRSDAVNTDRKQTVLVSFLTLQSVMR